MPKKTRIAFLHRYGLEGWVCCGGHAVPAMAERLAEDFELHFFGPRTTESPDPVLRARFVLHTLPFRWDRARPKQKLFKTLLWYFFLPWTALRCRLLGVRLVWNDETFPLTAWILKIFYGGRTAITVMDFFVRIYTDRHPRLRFLRDLVEKIDFAGWRRTDLLFVKVLYTRQFLARHGVPPEKVRLYRNPVDLSRFHPLSPAERRAARERFGFAEGDIVLTHHGILHPNKGNDWILRRLAEILEARPDLPLRFLLIGDGPEKPRLEKLADRLGLADRVVFTGWLPSEAALNEALACADIGLVMRIGQPTDHFHMTDTLAHETACAKPVLAVNLRGIAEIIRDGENGFLFDPDDPAAFREKLLALAADTALRRKTGEAALETIRRVGDTAAIAEALARSIREVATR